jgi:transcriptional regulator of acetoin/glycerol metabolism
VRVISATNADLQARIREGSFREDLYYRLNVIELRLPPLGERSDDILPLAEHFLQGRATLDSAARAALLAHAWPGNVRELKNAIERASLLCRDGVIQARDLDLGPARPGGGRLPAEAEPDKGMIEAALQRARGVISQAAADLGLSRQALYRRMEKMGIGS